MKRDCVLGEGVAKSQGDEKGLCVLGEGVV